MTELCFRTVPTAADIARRLGVPEHSVGVVRPPTSCDPGCVDVNRGGGIERVCFTVDTTMATVPARARRRVEVVRVPPSPEVQRQAQRRQVADADRARWPEVERRHRRALVNLAAEDLVRDIRVRGALPAWALGQPTVLVAAATRAPDIARRFNLSTGDCASCGTVLALGDGSPATCRTCRIEVEA